MPLIIICGNPSSGKTTRAKQIAIYLQQKHNSKVIIINQQYLDMQKNTYYQSAKQQKILRGKIKFQVQKNLISNNIVIVDSLNYIKGYRYQMYCIARQQKTTYCVVFCNTSLEVCKIYNQKCQDKNKFSLELLEDLTKRMEPPHLKNRWDIPLFQRRQQQATPVQDIANVLLFQNKKSKDPVSTKQDQKLSQNYLSQLDQIVQLVCDDALMGKLKLINNWSPFDLKKVKKDFTHMAKQKIISLQKVKQSFLQYLIEADKRK